MRILGCASEAPRLSSIPSRCGNSCRLDKSRGILLYLDGPFALKFPVLFELCIICLGFFPFQIVSFYMIDNF